MIHLHLIAINKQPDLIRMLTFSSWSPTRTKSGLVKGASRYMAKVRAPLLAAAAAAGCADDND